MLKLHKKTAAKQNLKLPVAAKKTSTITTVQKTIKRMTNRPAMMIAVLIAQFAILL